MSHPINTHPPFALAFIFVTVFGSPPVWCKVPAYPGKKWQRAEPVDAGMDAAKLRQARDYALTGGGSGYVTRHGKLVLSWGDPKKKYDLKSTTKSIGVTALGLALKDGKMKLDDKASKYHPTLGTPPKANEKTGWIDDITLLHLATQTAGFDKRGGYTRLMFKPGTKWRYSDGGPNWLAECITLLYRRDLNDLMFERVFTPVGIGKDDLSWRTNAYRDKKIAGVMRREFGSGIHANVDAMARIGYLYLREGKWERKEILPEDFVAKARATVPGVVGLPVVDGDKHDKASDHYGLLWWNNADGTLKDVPRDAYWSWGLYDSLIVVIPSLDVVVSRAGKSWKRDKGAGHYEVLKPFLGPIVASVRNEKKGSLIKGIEWAPKETIIRKAKGGDNWPITWGDDGALYTAYGDGRGFEPFVKEKLSLGLARVTGGPEDFKGANLRSPTAERKGNGARGPKASGMLMVDGVLYMLVRNTGNARLAHSRDRGKTWKWCDWKFTESFGCPTFLNFGKDYHGARDNYVYVYSFDSDSAYQPADRMVLARVPKDRLTERSAYEFFTGLDDKGGPRWSKDVKKRGAVLERKGKCYRSGVSYNAALKRYLWVALPGRDTRFKGGLSVYEATQPWGPWVEVFSTDEWDVGPGESASFPTKWMSDDGRTAYLVFSGDDCFSVRRATFLLNESFRGRLKPGQVYPGKEWATKKPADVGLDEAKLRAFSEHVGGRGCVVRYGHLVYAWGDANKRGDVASAAKPVYAHFLLRAVEEKTIPGLDENVARYEPGLAELNKVRDFKDRAITWRHLANQTSCYGVTEKPGTAYDYSDWQMALFWDLLFRKVYGATYDNVDEKVLRPLLADAIQCQDDPTFLAFGTRNRPGRLAISPRDFARFGLLYLRGGRWGDRQLLSAEHVKLATSSPLPNDIPRTAGEKAAMLPGQRSIGGGNNQTDHFGSYSFLWWTNGADRAGKRHWPGVPEDVYGAFGHGGKRALVIFPGHDLIVSWNDTKIDGRATEGNALRLLLEAIRGG